MPVAKNPAKRRRPVEGEIEFRLLCPTIATGGLIGTRGSIINRLKRNLSCSLDIDLAVSSSAKDRQVRVIGSTSLDRTLRFDNCDIPVSAAQEGLFRVFERVLEAEAEAGMKHGGTGGIVKCRMLVGPGGVMGEGGERVNMIERETGAFVKVWRARLMSDRLRPPSAGPTDDLIQISGDSVAVKRALVHVSRCVQKKTLKMMGESHKTVSPVAKVQSNIGRVVDVVEVSFRLLCPYGPAGWIIGANGKGVRALQQETGASIYFIALRDGCDHRVVVVSAFEDRKSEYSCAQNAVARVFSEIFSLEKSDTMTARLLILPNQSDWLRAGEISILSAIQNATGAALQVVDLDNSPLGASADAKVLQIDGDGPSVQVALFQVSEKLRERAFETTLAKNNTVVQSHKLLNGDSDCDEIGALTDDMSSCRVSEEFPSEQWLTSSVSSRDLATVYGGSGFGSCSKSAIVTKTQLEIAVGEAVFGAVFGDNCSNLARLRQISGATVEVHNPCPGSEGKVIISGTRDETMVAQSILQAFLMSAQ